MGRNVSKEYVPVYSLSVVSLIPCSTRYLLVCVRVFLDPIGAGLSE